MHHTTAQYLSSNLRLTHQTGRQLGEHIDQDVIGYFEAQRDKYILAVLHWSWSGN